MKTPLLPTQIADVEAICAAEDLPNFSLPGTGKTLTAIGAIAKSRLQSGLIVCPTVATIMWTDLLASELGARVQHLKTRTTEIDKKADFLVASYGVINNHVSSLFNRDNDALVIDESHYVKNSDAARTQAFFGEDGDGMGALYQSCRQCWLLSGTPIERYADDLWSQLRATQPEVLQQYGVLTLPNFQRKFCRMELKEYADGRVQKYISVGNQSTRLLNTMLYTDIGAIRRTMADVDPYMPETTFRNIFTKAKVTPELKSLLMGISEAEIMDRIVGGKQDMLRARQLMGLAKLTPVVQYIKEQSYPVLVGFWHTEVGRALVKELNSPDVRVGYIDGAVSPAKREAIRQAAKRGDIDILVGQIAAMGVAMDGLQEAIKHVIFAESDWSAAKMEQFYKRVARKGQTEHVQVDYCTSMEAIDTALEKVRKRKESGAEEILAENRT